MMKSGCPLNNIAGYGRVGNPPQKEGRIKHKALRSRSKILLLSRSNFFILLPIVVPDSDSFCNMPKLSKTEMRYGTRESNPFIAEAYAAVPIEAILV